MPNVCYHFEDIPRFTFDFSWFTSWLSKAAKKEGYSIEEINYIYCSDNLLLDKNREYLNHDFFTDILTFDNRDVGENLFADIFISIDRVRDNAKILNIPFDKELARVMMHGLLHLVGYSDNTEEDKIIMREKEDSYLSLLSK